VLGQMLARGMRADESLSLDVLQSGTGVAAAGIRTADRAAGV
jgi:hypothetical protein